MGKIIYMENRIPDEEIITRFEKDLKYVNKNRQLKFSAFIPSKKDPFSISVYCISDLTKSNKQTEIWAIGDNWVYKSIGKRSVARADLKVDDIRRIKLSKLEGIYSDTKLMNEYEKRHAEIKINKDSSLDDKKDIALELIKIAKHILR